MSKSFSRISRGAVFLAGLSLSACALVPPSPSSPPSSSPEPAVQERRATPPSQQDSPRVLASLSLTEQARALLESGRVDDAIRTLEHSMNVNPSNGQNYYYLAEAWLQKGNLSQAVEFNRLAALYLRDDPDWTSRVKDQQERIRRR